MKTEHILLVIIGAFFSALLVFLIIVYKPIIPFSQNQSPDKKTMQQAISTEDDTINNLKSKIKWLEEKANSQTLDIEDFKTFVASQSAKPTVTISKNKTILDFSSTKGSTFTTTSGAYTPMGMYVNINCSKSCLLFINFYTSSKNIGSPSSSQGNTNTYNVFLDNSDQSVFSQASFHADSSYVPVSISVTLSAGVGVHTIDIRAKTSAGTLQSDSSGLQVMAIEK